MFLWSVSHNDPFFFGVFVKSLTCKLLFRYQEIIRTARGDNEVALFNAKRRRIIYTLVHQHIFLQRDKRSSVVLCCILLCSEAFVDWLPLSRQDDSDEEPSTADQTPEHDELMEYVSLSCEEGEETTSSEVPP